MDGDIMQVIFGFLCVKALTFFPSLTHLRNILADFCIIAFKMDEARPSDTATYF